MRTNDTSLLRLNQVLSALIEHNKTYAPFGNDILEKMLICNMTMSHLDMSYEWLSRQIACCTKTIQRHINKMIKTGILSKKFRFKLTNVYTFGLEVKSLPFLEMLATHFQWFKSYLKRKSREIALKALTAVSAGGVLQSFRIININKTVTVNSKQIIVSSPVSTVLKKSIEQNRKTVSIISQKGMIMIDMNELGSPLLAKVQQRLQLTLAGTIAFSGWPDAVLEEALYEYGKQKGRINKPFYWFSSLCARIARQKNIRQDVLKVRLLQEQYDINDKESPKRLIDQQLANIGKKTAPPLAPPPPPQKHTRSKS